jgi:RNA polymerase sigma-70 factor (ECF subfamily)
MSEHDWMAERFETNRSHLRAVAYRMLGSPSEADDAVQEAWLRFSRSDPSGVENIGGWLTTVVARVCLDALRSRQSRREDTAGVSPPEPGLNRAQHVGPEDEVLLADSVGPALLVVLETLSPAERVAFVLHDIFDVPFNEIGEIVGRSPDAARQLASRARRRVRGAEVSSGDSSRQREVVDAFLAATRGGDFEALLAILDPDIVLRADDAAVQMGTSRELRGVAAIGERFSGAAALRPAFIDGAVGLVWAPARRVRVAFVLTFAEDDRIVRIEQTADPERLGQLEVVVLDG